jgi:hypothetical protein
LVPSYTNAFAVLRDWLMPAVVTMIDPGIAALAALDRLLQWRIRDVVSLMQCVDA